MWKKIVLAILIILSAVVGIGVAKVQSTMTNTLNQVTRDKDSVLKQVDLKGIKVNSDKEIVNILLLGNDFRVEKNGEDFGGLPDVIMIATMDKKHNSLKLTSIMRDTLALMTDGTTQTKINSSFNYGEGGVKNLYKTIAQNFNIKLDGYAMVGFDAFEKVVNAVGGVTVDITDTEMRYLNHTNYIRKNKNKTIKVGKQKLNGDQALAYCRIRKGYDIIGEPVVTANGLTDDYGRTWRQRTVLTHAFSKMKGLSLNKWIDVANDVLESVKTDLDNDSIMSYMKDLIFMGVTDVRQLRIPYDNYFYSSDGSVYQKYSLVCTNGVSSTFDTSVNSAILNDFIFNFKGDKEYEYNPGNQSE